ncbi:two-component system phosphate regulon response regulator PhoB [Litorimonas taeanensis]|uniref:Phosphate regulon transcriptional regulatory protein PhoB n=1 Tax=Litorimonas taeanensis TaxID=568099 RepID=A0A420WDD8_9PROT|nr:phosphate regulon transcriptional regulator PhoB [Litorimonas taeanensis]RKQ69054.1 two-component system phosphate regulon response regulator PhoB [Litorimonas taeanensis]
MKPYVLIVEDEDALSTLLEYNFTKEGYETAIAEDGEEALLMAEERTPDLILLDWMLPKLSGVEVCRRLRRNKKTTSTPVIMLTARSDETDKITGLDYGADDYLVKPFSMPELFARTRSLLRRAKPALLQDIIVQGDIEVDMQAFRVKRGEKTIHLGPTEFRLLEHFIKNPGRVFSREQLLDTVWGRDVYVEARTVDVHIGRLRKALGAPKLPDPIRTVRSAGYAFEPKA